MARKKVKKKRVSHNSSLKLALKRRGKRLAHGYEIVSRVRKAKKPKKKATKRRTKKKSFVGEWSG